MGRTGRTDGTDGRKSKVSFKILHTLFVYRLSIYLLIHEKKNCHQQCYGFQNLMSNWGWGSKISDLQQVGDYFFLGSKSVIFFTFFHYILKRILNVKLGVGVKKL